MCFFKSARVSLYRSSWFHCAERCAGVRYCSLPGLQFMQIGCRTLKSATFTVIFMLFAGNLSTFADTHYVSLSSPFPSAPFTTWKTAATNIQQAIDEASAGDTVLVADGTYDTGGMVVHEGLTNRIAIVDAISVNSLNGPHKTFIVGQGPIGDMAVRCAYVVDDAVLNGFTLTNGHTRSNGGGVWCESRAVLANCVLVGNSARMLGGGVSGGILNNCTLVDNFADKGGGTHSSELKNCTLKNNFATSFGGGAYGGTLSNCVLIGNFANSGGGVAEGELNNCTLMSNSVSSFGGGASDSTLINSILSGNFSLSGGGAAGGQLSNCTLTGNTAERNGGGAYGSVLNNCILYYNSVYGFSVDSNYSSCLLTYSCTTPLPEGVGNISDEPLLAGPVHLSESSPCRGAGNGFATGTDIDGDTWRDPPSMGCDEVVVDSATGALTVAVSANFSQVVVGYDVSFAGAIVGHPTQSVWSFGDGFVVSNRPYVSHAWDAAGTYEIEFTAWNTTHTNGVIATVLVEVVEEAVHYVRDGHTNAIAPYVSWETAASTIQDAIDAARIAGASVLVDDGEYSVGEVVVHDDLMNRIAITNPVTVRSVNGPRRTVIVGNGPMGGSAIRCAYVGHESVLSGFTLTNGYTRLTGDLVTERSGGGAWCEPSGILTNCIVIGNFADNFGGGVYNGVLNNSMLKDNSAESGGGAYDSRLNNCALTGNSAENGGGVYDTGLKNCTLTANSARFGGGAFGSDLTNCIVFYNSAHPSSENFNESCTFQFSCTDPLPEGEGNIVNDPLLAGPIHLSANSPCRQAGSTDSAVGVDIDGDMWLDPPSMGCDEYHTDSATGALDVSITGAFTRVAVGVELELVGEIAGHPTHSVWFFGDGAVVSNRPHVSHAWDSAGTYEVRFGAFNVEHVGGVVATVLVEVVEEVIHYVRSGNTNAISPYVSWETAASTIQDAIDAVRTPNALVWVDDGAYSVGGTVVDDDLMNRIAVTNPVTVRSVNGPSKTMIVGEGPLGSSAVRCAYLGSDAVLSGFTLTNGYTSTNEISTERSGGGVWCEPSATLTNCVIIGNRAEESGGGVFGGTLDNCKVVSNSARWGGGADEASLTNCVIVSNLASNSGGGTFLSDLDSCTVTMNTASNYGGGVVGGKQKNSIVYFNNAHEGDENYSSSIMQSCCTTPLPAGTNNISSSPNFMDDDSGDFRLKATSPCIDAGNNEEWMLNTTDIGGCPRVGNGKVDIGAHEFYFDINLSALLEGAYLSGEGEMSTHLSNTGILPLTSPYGADRRTVDSIPLNATDWVLMQLRETDESPIYARSLFVRKDGGLIDESGSTHLAVDVSPGTNYSFVVKHRNHMVAMSADPVSFTTRELGYDFTVGPNQYIGGTNAAVEVDAGIWALRSGDVDGNGRVQDIDLDIFDSQFDKIGYMRSDVNLDGVVDGDDRFTIKQRLGTTSVVVNPGVNLRPSLRITPPRRTLIEGRSLTLTASEFTGPVMWGFVENHSGGSIDANHGVSVTYTADNISGGVDVIQAWDSSNRLAQAFLNVISPEEAGALGKAVIVAGGLSEQDLVWPATDYLGDKAFRTFEDRGVAEQNVHYLSLGPEKDVLGAGNETNDIFRSHVTSNDLEDVFTDWAGENTDRLTVYMVDHGADASGFGQFRLNGTELIPAATMAGWLNDLQDENTNLHVTVILDFCYAGSYLDELGYEDDPPRRIVISSTAADELAYFIADGRISFSEFFFNGVLQGRSLLGSYELARDAMTNYVQHAWLDDNQDGVYQPGVDGVYASNQYIGASFIVGKDFPIIGSVLGNQSLSEDSSVLLWAENIESFYDLERVWCTILPPGYGANPTSGVPVIEVTTRDLMQDPLTGRYETEFEGFTEQGQYTIAYYAEDIWGSVSPPIQRFVVQDGFKEKVILVAGGDASDTNRWSAVLSTAQLAYQTLQSRLIASSNIYVLSESVSADWNGDRDQRCRWCRFIPVSTSGDSGVGRRCRSIDCLLDWQERAGRMEPIR